MGFDDRAAGLVGDADDAAFGHGGMRQQGGLDLGAGREPAGNDRMHVGIGDPADHNRQHKKPPSAA